jgi:hypothetical protein
MNIRSIQSSLVVSLFAILATACSTSAERVSQAGQRDSVSGALGCQSDDDCHASGLRDASCHADRGVCVVASGGSCWNDADCDGAGSSCEYVAATDFGTCRSHGQDDVSDHAGETHACGADDDCELGEFCGGANACQGTARAHCDWDGDCSSSETCDWSTGRRDHAGNFRGYCVGRGESETEIEHSTEVEVENETQVEVEHATAVDHSTTVNQSSAHSCVIFRSVRPAASGAGVAASFDVEVDDHSVGSYSNALGKDSDAAFVPATLSLDDGSVLRLENDDRTQVGSADCSLVNVDPPACVVYEHSAGHGETQYFVFVGGRTVETLHQQSGESHVSDDVSDHVLDDNGGSHLLLNDDRSVGTDDCPVEPFDT